MEKAPDHKTVEYGKYKIHAFTVHKESKHPHQVAGTLFKPDVLVVASNLDLLKTALDVLGGKAPSLAGKQSPLAIETNSGRRARG